MRLLPILILMLAVVAFRIAVGGSDDATYVALANFSPLAALALTAGALIPRKWALAVPVGAVILSWVGLHLVKPHAFEASPIHYAVVLAAFAAVFVVGRAIRHKTSLPRLLGASVCGTLLFYVLTNTASFFIDPGYQKTLGGWLQSLTTGVPGPFPPAYVFLLKSLAGDLLFTVAIAIACGVRWRSAAPAPSVVPAECRA